MTRLDWKISKALRRMQRRRERHTAKQITYKLAAVMLLTGAAVLLSGAAEEPTEKICVEHVVKKHDTLRGIAEKYRPLNTANDVYIMEYLDEIKRLNPELSENHNQVFPGQTLRIEYEVKAGK